MYNYESILEFWFQTLHQEQWWQADDAIDARLAADYGDLLDAAAKGELWHWRYDMRGRLAEIIILDQFSRMVHRGTPQAFAQDAMALALSQEAVRIGGYEDWPGDEQAFLIMPYMHSESRIVHTEALKLFSAPALAGNLAFEERHKAIIDRFGRYPHRNAVLGRASTAVEIAFLKTPGSAF